MRRTEIAEGGDCGGLFSSDSAVSDWMPGSGRSMAERNAASALTSIWVRVELGWTAAFQLIAVGTCSWQQP